MSSQKTYNGRESEPFRPLHHFTPPHMWMNDPNGLVYYAGEYHLFYQYHPASTVWGSIHWGHAVSRDLIRWEHLPIALYPDELGMIFSGSAVIDWHNTAGFGREAMVAIFTHHNENHQQSQSIAYSIDKGRTWQKYSGNPVVPTPNNLRDFRDPKVFWYGSPADGHWVMIVAAGDAIRFYTSPDLKQWIPSGLFGHPYGATCGVWETPDLFELPLEATTQSKWVLTTGVGACAPAGGTGTQYFVGQFNGRTFTCEDSPETVRWADYGADFYAAQSWSDTADGRRIWLGWMNNWQYAKETPTATWRSSMSLPRELRLVQTAAGVVLAQRPVAELAPYRGQHHSWHNTILSAEQPLLTEIQGETLEINATLQMPLKGETTQIGFKLRTGTDEATTITYDIPTQQLTFDRSTSGLTDFHEHFGRAHHVTVSPLPDGTLQLHFILDRASVELFVNDGLVTLTNQIFPYETTLGLQLFVNQGELLIQAIDVYHLKATPQL